MNPPQVSVILTAYNSERFLAEAVRSVLSQTFTDWELLIVDDGSTDGTPEIAKGFEQAEARCRFVPTAHSGLPAHARNTGLRQVRTPYVAFLDSDDAWLPDKLHDQVEAMAAEPDLGLTYTNGFVILGEVRTDRILYPPAKARSCEAYTTLLWLDQIPTSSVLARSEAVNRVGGFRENRRLRQVEDYDLWLRIGARYRMRYVDQPLILYRRHPDGISEDRLQGAWNTFFMRWRHFTEAGRFVPILLGAQCKEVGRILYYTFRR